MRARVRTAALGVVPALAALALLAAGAATPAATGTPPHEVVIQALQYVPQTLTVHRGDVVVWTNKDPFPHTVTALGAFDSHSIAAGASWRFTAKKAGTYDYICTLHSNMKGTLQVQ